MATRFCALALVIASAVGSRAYAGPSQTIDLSPTQDTFVYAGRPSNTYGTAGAMNVSGPGMAGGPFKSAMMFDATPAAANFNLTFGVGGWTVTSVKLALTEDGNPPSPLFPRGAGTFQLAWLSNDNWSEGVGTPSSPGTASGNQLSYTYLQTLLGSSTQNALGTFNNSGLDSQHLFNLNASAAGFVSDIMAGDFMTLVETPVSSSIGFTYNSSNYFNPASRPVLSITAAPIPEPATCMLLGCGVALSLMRRTRRGR